MGEPPIKRRAFPADTENMSPSDHLSSTRLGPVGSNLRIATPNGLGQSVTRSAVCDGRPVVTLRSGESGAGTTVECVVRPADPSAPAQVLGPYAFASQAEARSFGDELMLALEYLGCELVDGEG